jgi:hypothetical protein
MLQVQHGAGMSCSMQVMRSSSRQQGWGRGRLTGRLEWRHRWGGGPCCAFVNPYLLQVFPQHCLAIQTPALMLTVHVHHGHHGHHESLLAGAHTVWVACTLLHQAMRAAKKLRHSRDPQQVESCQNDWVRCLGLGRMSRASAGGVVL